jgi:hypothetical protein
VSSEENKAVIRRLVEEVYNDNNLDVLDELASRRPPSQGCEAGDSQADDPPSFGQKGGEQFLGGLEDVCLGRGPRGTLLPFHWEASATPE